MSEISDILQQRAGLNPDQAQEVEQLIIQAVVSKLPSEFQGTVSTALGGGGAAASGGLGGLLGMAEGLLGGNKG